MGAGSADRIVIHVQLADVAELADAQASGACALRGVEVRVLSSALSPLYREALRGEVGSPRESQPLERI